MQAGIDSLFRISPVVFVNGGRDKFRPWHGLFYYDLADRVVAATTGHKCQ
jgi:hypothetical protein